MAGGDAGTVTAKLVLETTSFNESLNKSIEEVRRFVNAFNNTTFGKLEQEMATLKENLKTIQSEMKNVIDVSKKIDSQSSSYNNAKKNVDNYTDSIKKSSEAQTNLEEVTKKSTVNIKNSVQSNLDSATSSLNKFTTEFKRVQLSMNTGFSSNVGQGVQTWVNQYMTSLSQARTELSRIFNFTDLSKNIGFSENIGQGVQSWVNQLTKELSIARTKLKSEIVELNSSIKNVFDFSQGSGWKNLTKPLEMINTTQITAGLRLLNEEMDKSMVEAEKTAKTVNEIFTSSSFNTDGITRYNNNFTELNTILERVYPQMEKFHAIMNQRTTRQEEIQNIINGMRLLNTEYEKAVIESEKFAASTTHLNGYDPIITNQLRILEEEFDRCSIKSQEMWEAINRIESNRVPEITRGFQLLDETIVKCEVSSQQFANNYKLINEQFSFNPQITSGLRLLEEEMDKCIIKSQEFAEIYQRNVSLINNSYGQSMVGQWTQSEMAINQCIGSLERMEFVLETLNRSILTTSNSQKVLDTAIQQGILNDETALNELIATYEKLQNTSRGYSLNPTNLASGIEQTITKVEELNLALNTSKESVSQFAYAFTEGDAIIKGSFDSLKLSANEVNSNIARTTASLERYNTVANVTNGVTKQIAASNESVAASTTTANSGMNAFTNNVNNSKNAVTGLASSLMRVSSLFKLFGSLYVFQTVIEMGKAVTQTVKYKSEMETLVKQLGWSTSQVDYFNKSLDNTIKTYQKMNKYNMGETLASLGQEFGLGVKELEQAAPVLAMVQSEYVRAGRSTDEATLAVKDVLQGEFVRLSRETGVGKGELMAAGWSGDNKDVRSLLTALKSIGESRHWDMFATKATSLTDVMTILQNRFGEFAGNLVSQVTPLFLLFFNGAINLFEKLGGALDWLNNKLGGGLTMGGWAAAIGIATTALVMYRTEAGLVQIAQMGLTKTITATILGIEAEKAATLSSTEMIGAKILGLTEETVQYGSLNTAILMKNMSEVISNTTGQESAMVSGLKAAGLAEEEAAVLSSTIAYQLQIGANQELNFSKVESLTMSRLLATGMEGERAAMIANATATNVVNSSNLGYVGTLWMKLAGLNATEVAEYGLATATWAGLLGVNASTIANNSLLTTIGARIVSTLGLTTAQEAETVQTVGAAAAHAGFTVTEELLTSAKLADIAATMGLTAATAALLVVVLPITAAIVALIVVVNTVVKSYQQAAEVMSTFNGLVDNGDSIIKEAQENLETYHNSVTNLKEKLASCQEGTQEYKTTQEQLTEATRREEQANKDLASAIEAVRWARSAQSTHEQYKTSAALDRSSQVGDILRSAGITDEAKIQSAVNEQVIASVKGSRELVENNRMIGLYSEKYVKNMQKLKDVGYTGDDLLKKTEEYGQMYQDVIDADEKMRTSDNGWDRAFGSMEKWWALKKIDWANFWNFGDFGGIFKIFDNLPQIDIFEKIFGFSSWAGGSIADFLVKNVATPISNWFNGLGPWISNGLNSILTPVTNWFNGLGPWISNGLNSILTPVTNWFNGLGPWLWEQLNNIWTTVSEWFMGLPMWIWEQLNNIWIGITEWFNNSTIWLTEILNNIWLSISTWFMNLPIYIAEQLLNLWNTINTSIMGIVQLGMNLGSQFVNAVISWVSQLPGQVYTWLINTASYIWNGAVACINNAKNMGRDVVNGVIDYVKDLPGKVYDEFCKIGQKILDAAGGVVEKAKQFGSQVVKAALGGFGINSPGHIQKAVVAEFENTVTRVSDTSKGMYQATQSFAQEAMSGFNNNYNTPIANVSNSIEQPTQPVIDQPVLNPNANQQAINQYGQDQVTLQAINTETMLQTQTTFNGMSTTVGDEFVNMGGLLTTTFDGLKTKTATDYQTLNTTTATQMQNMQTTTTKHIQGITNSWNQMETALINSASNIRQETGSHIKNLESNMASFWSKVQNPGLLIASAGPMEYSRGHYSPRSISSRRSVGSAIRVAGSPNMGISNKYRASSKNDPCLDYLGEYLKNNRGVAGGWGFDWTPEIKGSMNDWHTHFGPIYDGKLRVGKFYNDDFPVRRDTDIFKNYVLDAIGRTSYEFYWDSKYGNALNAWNAGHFNCYDGALVVMALAKAFGLGASMVHTTWDGIGHMVTNVEGVGIVDATAIQNGYGLSAPGKYAGPLPVRRFSGSYGDSNTTNNDNKKVINVNIDLRDSNLHKEDDLVTKIENTCINVMSDIMEE